MNGKPIENAAVVFHPMEGEKDKGNMELKTNEDGKTIIDVLPIGDTVRLQVIARGFQTYGDDYKIDKAEMAIEIRLRRPGEQYSIYKQSPRGSGRQRVRVRQLRRLIREKAQDEGQGAGPLPVRHRLRAGRRPPRLIKSLTSQPLNRGHDRAHSPVRASRRQSRWAVLRPAEAPGERGIFSGRKRLAMIDPISSANRHWSPAAHGASAAGLRWLWRGRSRCCHHLSRLTD